MPCSNSRFPAETEVSFLSMARPYAGLLCGAQLPLMVHSFHLKPFLISRVYLLPSLCILMSIFPPLSLFTICIRVAPVRNQDVVVLHAVQTHHKDGPLSLHVHLFALTPSFVPYFSQFSSFPSFSSSPHVKVAPWDEQNKKQCPTA